MRLPKRLMDFLRSRRFRTALMCAPFAALILGGLWWAGTNWYGRWKFDRTVDELAARGFARTMKEAIGPMPGDEQNLLLLPVVSEERRAYELYCAERKVTHGSWGAAMGILGIAFDEMEHPEQEGNPTNVSWADLEDFKGLEGHEKAKQLLARIEFAEPGRKTLMEAMEGFRPGIADQAARSSNANDALDFLANVMISLESHGTLSLAAGRKNEARADFLATLRFAKGTQSTALPYLFADRFAIMVPDCLRAALMEPPPGMWSDADLQEFDAELKDAFQGELTMSFHRMHLPLLFELAARTHRNPPQRIDWKRWSRDWKWYWEEAQESLKDAWQATRPQGLRDLEWAEELKKLAAVTGDPETPTDWRANPPDPDKSHDAAQDIAFAMLGDLEVIFRDNPRWDGFQNWSEGGEVDAMMGSAMARWSIALDRHLLRRGSYPYSLDALDADLRKDLPPDPLSKTRFIYRKTATGFELKGAGISLDTGRTYLWTRNLPE